MKLHSRKWLKKLKNKRHDIGALQKDPRLKLSRNCKNMQDGNLIKAELASDVRKNKHDATVFNTNDQIDTTTDKEKDIAKHATVKTYTTKDFNDDYSKTIQSIANETSRNQTTPEQYYGKRITFIVLLSTVSTVLLFAIIFAICKKTCWSRFGKLNSNFDKPLYEQTSEVEASLKQFCTCADESSSETYSSDCQSESVSNCLKFWQKNKHCETKANAERTSLMSARRKKKRKKKRRKKVEEDLYSTDDTVNCEHNISDKHQKRTWNRLSQRNILVNKANHCIYQTNDPNCKCRKCRKYVTMCHGNQTSLT